MPLLVSKMFMWSMLRTLTLPTWWTLAPSSEVLFDDLGIAFRVCENCIMAHRQSPSYFSSLYNREWAQVRNRKRFRIALRAYSYNSLARPRDCGVSLDELEEGVAEVELFRHDGVGVGVEVAVQGDDVAVQVDPAVLQGKNAPSFRFLSF